ncbi:MAG: SAM-dependent methyltransferase [Peptococcaceae bacterium]|nr:SAM-dependent methyltransferase [Peptococcaceae bacterium]
MNKLIKLGPRLKTIASFVPRGTSLGDIGTDHAYLPVYLLQAKAIVKAIGVDNNQGPYESALETVRTHGLADIMEIRLGDGLVPLQKGEVETLVIAGMGGKTILKILQSNPPVMEEIKTLILQPQSYEEQVRVQLLRKGWKIKAECLVAEEDLIYIVFCFSRFEGYSLVEIEKISKELAASIAELTPAPSSVLLKFIWKLGPLLLWHKDKLLPNTIEQIIQQRQKIIKSMTKTERSEVKQATRELQAEINILEGIKKWLLQ